MTETALHQEDSTPTKKRTLDFMCEFCSTWFSTKELLSKHIPSHIGEKNFICLICGKGFNFNENLQFHQNIHQMYMEEVMEDGLITAPMDLKENNEPRSSFNKNKDQELGKLGEPNTNQSSSFKELSSCHVPLIRLETQLTEYQTLLESYKSQRNPNLVLKRIDDHNNGIHKIPLKPSKIKVYDIKDNKLSLKPKRRAGKPHSQHKILRPAIQSGRKNTNNNSHADTEKNDKRRFKSNLWKTISNLFTAEKSRKAREAAANTLSKPTATQKLNSVLAKSKSDSKLKQNICKICYRSFTSGYHLKKHIRVVHKGEDRHDCYFCKRTVIRRDNYSMHLKRAHLFEHRGKLIQISKPNYILNQIPKIMKVAKPMRTPMKQIPKRKRMRKPKQMPKTMQMPREKQISKKIEMPKQMVKAMQKPKPMQSQKIQCEVCKKVLCSKYSLRRHIKRGHEAMKKPKGMQNQKIQCEFCKKVLGSKYSLRRHIKRGHEAMKKPKGMQNQKVQCEVCKKVLCSKYSLRRHIKRGHEAMKKPKPIQNQKVHCEVCKKVLCSKYYLESHFKRVHEGMQKIQSPKPIFQY